MRKIHKSKFYLLTFCLLIIYLLAFCSKMYYNISDKTFGGAFMEEKFNLKRGVIFDLDGTMWDSSEAVTAAYNRSLERVGLDIRLSRSDVMAVMGKTMTEIAHIYFDAIDPNRAEDIMLDCIEEENEYLKTHCGEVYDGLEDTLSELERRGYFLACVSASGNISKIRNVGAEQALKRRGISALWSRETALNPLFMSATPSATITPQWRQGRSLSTRHTASEAFPRARPRLER